MRKRFDELFKSIINECIEPRDAFRAEHPVDAELQRLDVYIDRDGDVRSADPRLGLLGVITAERVILEAFHSPPSSIAIGECVMKQRALQAKRERDERREASGEGRPERKLEVAMLWILSAGDPKTARRELGFRAIKGGPRGVYTLSRGWRTRLVVISQLAVDRQSLLLRLMGAGNTRLRAVEDLSTTYADGWEVGFVWERLTRLRLTLNENQTQFNATELRELEATMDVFERAEKFRAEVIQKGRLEGKLEGKLEGERIALHLVIASRKIALTPEEQARINACDDPRTLQSWLQNAAIAGTATDVFAER